MATTFPIPSQLRLAWHLDAAFVKRGIASGATWTEFTDTETASLNKEVSGAGVSVPSGGYLYVVGPLNSFTGYLLELSSGTAPVVEVTTVASPNNDSEWSVVEATATTQAATSYRTPHVLANAKTNVTGIRFRFTGTATITAFHLYGTLQRDMTILNLGGTDRPTPAAASFGMTAPQSGKPLAFRLWNGTDANRSIQVSLVASTSVSTGQDLLDQVWWSTNGHRYERYSIPFSVGATFKTLSDPFYLRRYVLSTHQNDTAWTLILKIASDAFTDYLYLYIDDVTTTDDRDTPVLYKVSDNLLKADADTYTLTTNVYTGTVRFVLAQAPRTAYLITSISAPTLVPAVADPRVIDTLEGRYDVDHYTHTFTLDTSTWGADWQQSMLGACSLVMIGQTIDAGVTSSYQSNGLSVTLETPPSAQPPVGTALRLKAVTHDGQVLADSVPYLSLGFTQELSDVGSGKVQLDFDADYWSDPDVETDLTPEFVATREFIWEAWEGNYLRWAWLNTTSEDALVNPQLSRTISISGPGLAHALTWSVVLPPSFPESTSPYWSFMQARLWQWLTIWASCVERTPSTSLQRQFKPMFTRYYDAAGNDWLDEGFELQQENGVSMLELLSTHCASTKCDFFVRPDRKIDVRYSKAAVTEPGKYFGIDRTEVIFYPTLADLIKVNYDRSDIGNFVVARDDYGQMSTKFNGDSITTHGMRERYVAAGRAGTASSRDTQAQEQLTWFSEQAISWTLSVAPYYETDDGIPFNRVFVDYELGDWIYVQPKGSTTPQCLQINAITINQDSEGVFSVELTLETLLSLLHRKSQFLAAQAGSGTSGNAIGNLLPNEEIFESNDPLSAVTLKYKAWPMSEIVTLGMVKNLPTDSAGTLAPRQFTRMLQRDVDWKREGWVVTILDPSVFDEAEVI